jgi:hypothetical protein
MSQERSVVRTVSRLIAIIAVCAMVSGGSSTLAQTESREYAIKAEFLLRFLQLVTWPPQALPDTSPTIIVGVLGRGPAGAALDTINGETVRGKRVVIRHLGGLEDLGHVHALFIAASEKDHLQGILEAVRNSSILTVGDEIKGFPQSGGIINLTRQGNGFRFEINRAAAGRARLDISSRLLRLAKVIEG